MPVGSPMYRPRSGSDRLVHGGWGTQPSGPLPSVPGPGRLGLPSKDTLDYVHSLTQTSLLVVGTLAFLVFYRHRPLHALRKLTGKAT